MAQGTFKSGEHINLTYHSAGDVTALTPTGVVYDEGSAVHAVETTALNSSLALAGHKKAGGVYMAGFEPDAEGEWTVVIDDGTGDGTAVKTYLVCGHNIDEVGDDAALAKNNADSATNAADSALAAAKSALAAATSALAQADSGTNASDSALAAAQSALAAAQSALAQADSAANAAQSAAAYAATAASSAAVAAVGSPAGIS